MADPETLALAGSKAAKTAQVVAASARARRGDDDGDENFSVIIADGRPPNIIAISWRSSIKQVVAAFVAHSLQIQVGIALSFSSVFLPQMQSGNYWDISTGEATWMASLIPITLPIGSMLAGPLMDRLGRKRTCQLVTLPFIVAWLVQANARATWHVCVSRITTGVSCGLCSVTLVYVAEISHPRLRSMLLGVSSALVSFGVLLTCLLEYFSFKWREMAIIFLSLVVMSLVSVSFLPESPQWHAEFRRDTGSAAKSLRWLYHKTALFQEQYKQLVKNQSQLTIPLCTAAHAPPSAITTGIGTTAACMAAPLLQAYGRVRTMFAQPAVYKPFLILAALFTAQQLSGSYAIMFYAGDLFQELGDPTTGDTNLLLFGAVRFAGTVASAACARYVGRRPMLLAAGIGMSVSILIAGFYLYLAAVPQQQLAAAHIEHTQRDDGIVPVYSVLAYVLCASFGLMSVPWTLTGELLPVRARGVLGGALVAYANVLMFAMVKAYKWVLDAVQVQCVFYVLAMINLCAVCGVFFCLPETLGKSAADMERYFNQR